MKRALILLAALALGSNVLAKSREDLTPIYNEIQKRIIRNSYETGKHYSCHYLRSASKDDARKMQTYGLTSV